ncbi:MULTISPECIES: hypothetical protein [unclassified Streptomyces]|uniref:hypothetical protein n=1 Tax=unclassified Streptomyces TaxID=2593676 RepID=UPI002E198145
MIDLKIRQPRPFDRRAQASQHLLHGEALLPHGTMGRPYIAQQSRRQVLAARLGRGPPVVRSGFEMEQELARGEDHSARCEFIAERQVRMMPVADTAVSTEVLDSTLGQKPDAILHIFWHSE